MAFRFHYCRSAEDNIFALGFDCADVLFDFDWLHTPVGRELVSNGNASLNEAAPEYSI